jgi:hypothetical protein
MYWPESGTVKTKLGSMLASASAMQKTMQAIDAIADVLVGKVRAGAANAFARRANTLCRGGMGFGIVDELKQLLAARSARPAAPVYPSLACHPF